MTCSGLASCDIDTHSLPERRQTRRDTTLISTVSSPKLLRNFYWFFTFFPIGTPRSPMHLGCFDYYSSSLCRHLRHRFMLRRLAPSVQRRKRNPQAESIVRVCNSFRTCLRVESRNVKKAPEWMTTHNRPRHGRDKMNMIKCKRFRKAKWRNTENQLSFWKIVPLIVEWTKSIEKGRWASDVSRFSAAWVTLTWPLTWVLAMLRHDSDNSRSKSALTHFPARLRVIRLFLMQFSIDLFQFNSRTFPLSSCLTVKLRQNADWKRYQVTCGLAGSDNGD